MTSMIKDLYNIPAEFNAWFKQQDKQLEQREKIRKLKQELRILEILDQHK